jgi:PilZ domain
LVKPVSRKPTAAFGKRLDVPGGRRTAERSPVRLPVSLQALNTSCPVTLLNVSRTGAKMSMNEEMYRGQEVWLTFGQAQIFGTVRWVRGQSCGISFDEPLGDRELALLQAQGQVARLHGLSAEDRMALADWKAGLAR